MRNKDYLTNEKPGNRKEDKNESKKSADSNDDNRIVINRKVYDYKDFHDSHPSDLYVGFSILTIFSALYVKHIKPSDTCLKKNLYNRVPAIKWIKNYNFKLDFLADLLSGMTVGIMHIPQGMAYALLATVPPIYGLYTSFFPVLIYWIFGTSRQLSIGTFAVISLMVGTTLLDLEKKYAPPVDFNITAYQLGLENNSTYIDTSNFLSLNREKARIMIAAAHAFGSAEPFVNSFLAGCAVHVFTSQVKFLLSLHLTPYSGIFKIPKSYFEIIFKLYETSIPTLVISIVCVFVLVVVKVFINERYQHKMIVPFPIEIVVVIFGTCFSYFFKFKSTYSVNTVGPIPPGLPGPEMPPLFIIKDMMLQSFLTAVVAFAINFSLSDLFSKKHKYKINATQELFAYGASNVFSSFFPCFTSGASLARSCVQDNAGGKTQLVSIFSCIIMGFFLLFIAPLFQELPQACLASIIVVALKGLLMQVGQLKYYWKVNKIEFFLFLTTFSSVTLLDVDIGLGIGIVFYIITHIIRSTQPYSTLLGRIPDTEIYKDIKLYKNAVEIDRIKIVRVQQELHATNAAKFKKSIYELTNLKPQEYMQIKNKIDQYKKKYIKTKGEKQNIFTKFFSRFLTKKETSNKVFMKPPAIYVIDENQKTLSPCLDTQDERRGSFEEEYWNEYEKNEHDADLDNTETESKLGMQLDECENDIDRIRNESSADRISNNENNCTKLSEIIEELDEIPEKKLKLPPLPLDFLIIDCSPINFIDTVGVKTLKQLVLDYNQVGIIVYLADCNDAVRSRFRRMEEAISTSKNQVKLIDDSILHLTIHDAVLKAKKQIRTNKITQLDKILP